MMISGLWKKNVNKRTILFGFRDKPCTPHNEMLNVLERRTFLEEKVNKVISIVYKRVYKRTKLES